MATVTGKRERSCERHSSVLSRAAFCVSWFCVGMVTCAIAYVACVAGLPVLFWHALSGAYRAIGIVFVGLFPLSLLLLGLAVKQSAEAVGGCSFAKSPVRRYDLISEAAPILGIMGTMLSLGAAMQRMDISRGMQDAIHEMSVQVGQALASSIYGITLALIAYFLKHLYESKGKERRVET